MTTHRPLSLPLLLLLLPHAVVTRAIALFGCEFFLSYGMTECCGKISMSILPAGAAERMPGAWGQGCRVPRLAAAHPTCCWCRPTPAPSQPATQAPTRPTAAHPLAGLQWRSSWRW